MTRTLATIADATAFNSTVAISFGDAKAAAETLSALRADPHVVTAAILLPDAMFARFDRSRHPAEIVLDRAAMKRAQPWQRCPRCCGLRIGRPIVLGRESIGTIYVESDLEMRARAVSTFDFWLCHSCAPSAWRSCCRPGCSGLFPSRS